MNVNGDKVMWGDDVIAVTDAKRGYTVYEHITAKNGDATAFRRWSYLDCFDDLDVAIEYAKNCRQEIRNHKN